MNIGPKNISGKRVNSLTAIRFSHFSLHKHAFWVYECDCGTELVCDSNSVNGGSPKSCGCKKLKLTKDKTRKRIKTVWENMIARCYSASVPNYKNYGRRGVCVCARWHNFEYFKKWALKSGYANNLTIERKNVNGNYTPQNCIWVTKTEQSYNRRNTIYISYQGQLKSIGEWSKIYNMGSSLIYGRLKRGMNSYQVFNKPMGVHKKKFANCEKV